MCEGYDTSAAQRNGNGSAEVEKRPAGAAPTGAAPKQDEEKSEQRPCWQQLAITHALRACRRRGRRGSEGTKEALHLSSPLPAFSTQPEESARCESLMATKAEAPPEHTTQRGPFDPFQVDVSESATRHAPRAC